VFDVRKSNDTTEHKTHIISGRMEAGHSTLEQEMVADSVVLAQALRGLALRTLGDRMGPAFKGWNEDAPWPDSVTDYQWSLQRLNLISSKSLVARRCYAGELAACETVLQLRPNADPIMEWFDAHTRLELVQSAGQTAMHVARDASQRCIAGSDSACVQVLRRLPPNFVPSGFEHSTHVLLTELALSVGGAEAPRRLVETPGGPNERLSAAAGMPIDSLVAIWQRRVRDARTPSDDMSPSIALASLSWILVLGGLSLRSSRWR
jgi:hypothetical protein